MASNVPDDWGCYWRRCTNCGHRYHLSEGGCDCEDHPQAVMERYLQSPNIEILGMEREKGLVGGCIADDFDTLVHPDEPVVRLYTSLDGVMQEIVLCEQNWGVVVYMLQLQDLGEPDSEDIARRYAGDGY